MAATKKVLKLIERAAKEGRKTLNINNKGLASLPAELSRLTKLTKLNLSDNQLTKLPPWISTLTSLTELDLSWNKLTFIQPEILKLTKLTSLNVSNNQLRKVPRRISELTSLIELHLHGNLLTNLPPEIGNLANLRELGLTGNKLTGLPAEIIKLSKLNVLSLNVNSLVTLPEQVYKLTSLTCLRLNGTELTNLSSQIGELSSLTELDVSANNLPNLPREIFFLTNLTSLDVSGNQLISLPHELSKLTNLTKFDAGQNQLTLFPFELTKLTSLTDLDLQNNLLKSVPPEISSLSQLVWLNLARNQLPISPETLDDPRDVKTILAAVAGLWGGERLNEAKMLVLGDGKVGKSSVVEQLLYGTFDSKKETTLGVEINDEMQVVQSEMKGKGEPVKLNIWDFGGQEIQHSTHQFFLTTRSLYLLVVDARKGEQISNIEYWLKLIQSFGGNSPIIIVINQIDQLRGQRPLNLDRKALQDKYNVKGFIETSCPHPPVGIEALRKAIAREVDQMKHVHDIWPREWLAIKRRLQEIQADYIPIEKYLEICGEENLNDEDIRTSLLGLLHDLGVVIRFPGDTQVLNPRWVTQGVYGLLTSAQLVNNQGQFDLKDINKILAGLPNAKDHYPPYTHERLLRVMEHFELCFEFTDRPGHYLIPRHLYDNEPDISWEDTGGLNFQYHYETLPDSVISRFIVRMNQFIAERYYWKNGVFLQSGENRAKVKADLVDRKIFISVIGKEQTRRAFLAIIRSALDEINGNFKIEINQMIPVPDAPEVLVSYQDLLAYEEANEAQIFIPQLRKKFSVRELLDGVEELSTRMERRERNSHEKDIAKRVAKEIQAKSQPRILRIVVASPSDVQAERDVMPSVIDEVNRGIAADHGLHLVLSRWETDSHPGFHPEGAQGLIDPILNITECDLLLGIFWTRFGTPTSDGTTGTEHEFKLAYNTWKEKGRPQIFIYFNDKPPKSLDSINPEQLRKVQEFKRNFPKEGLWWPYKGKAQFEKLVRNHLTHYIRSLH